MTNNPVFHVGDIVRWEKYYTKIEQIECNPDGQQKIYGYWSINIEDTNKIKVGYLCWLLSDGTIEMVKQRKNNNKEAIACLERISKSING